MIHEYLKAIKEPGQQVNPLFGFLGVEVEEISKERAVLKLPLRRDFIQGGGVTAGGIISTLADEAMAHAALARLGDKQITATIEMNLRFLRPIREGELRAVAVVQNQGKRVITLEAVLEDGEGRVVARAGASFMINDLG